MADSLPGLEPTAALKGPGLGIILQFQRVLLPVGSNGVIEMITHRTTR